VIKSENESEDVSVAPTRFIVRKDQNGNANVGAPIPNGGKKKTLGVVRTVSRSQDVSADQLSAIGAFLSGMGSVLSAVWYVRAMRKRFHAECEERLQAFRDGLHEAEVVRFPDKKTGEA
jgi:hypothetical protein